jgi:hypothetical protein
VLAIFYIVITPLSGRTLSDIVHYCACAVLEITFPESA